MNRFSLPGCIIKRAAIIGQRRRERFGTDSTPYGVLTALVL